MPAVSNLSPLAFQILKYLCNSNTPGDFQGLDKLTFGIESQEDFLNALDELHGRGLISLSRDVDTTQDIEVIDYTSETMYGSNTPGNNAPVRARINSEAGDICRDMDYFLAAGQELK